MKKSLENALEDLQALKLYMSFQNESFKITNRFFRDNAISTYNNLPGGKIKRFNYNSYIISLYGIFERFIEKMIHGYLEQLCKIVRNYSDLPIQIQNFNIDKNIDILTSLKIAKYRNVKPELLIKILNDNLNYNISVLNNNAFTQHKSNFRINTIDDLLNGIGIIGVSNDIRHYSPLKEKLENDFSDIFTKKATILFRFIDDLAERRNEIAHGVENVTMLNSSILEEYVDFIALFCNSFYKLLNDSLNFHIVRHQTVSLVPIKVINSSILCCSLDHLKLSKSSRIIVTQVEKYPRYIVPEIMDIQIDGNSVETVDGNGKVDVGIQLNGKVKATNTFSLINSI